MANMAAGVLLTPDEFVQLQEYASYSSAKIGDVLEHFKEGGSRAQYSTDGQTIGYAGFCKLLGMYLEADSPNQLCEHLFLSFIKRRQSADAAMHAGQTGGGSTALVASSSSFPDHHNLKVISDKITETRHTLHVKMSHLKNEFHHLGERITKSGSYQNVCRQQQQPSQTARSPFSPGESPNHEGMATCSSAQQLYQLGDECGSQCSVEPLHHHMPEHRQLALTASTAKELASARVRLKDIVCYLSLIEGGRPEDKLEFVFHLYDSDGNGYLDSSEMERIIEQMLSVARYLGWDTIELEPIVRDMMREIDYDSDGTVTLSEWKRGGLSTVPLLVLLGFDSDMKEDGTHLWKLRRFKRAAMCNVCLQHLVAWGGKQGLSCTLCKYTVHERCVSKVYNNCISTYVKRSRRSQTQPAEPHLHHWVDGNCAGKCARCKKSVKIFDGKHCRWCQTTIHNRCAPQFPAECNLGALAAHILPPTAIRPAVLDRRLESEADEPDVYQSSGNAPSTSFQITAPPGCTPLAVFINPRSGGKQGEKLYRKFQYLLNPRQVYNLSNGGPTAGLRMFMGVPCNILCCGGDGTVGWVLDAIDKIYPPDVQRPPVAVLPLGTGNDLARCLNWGGGYEHESLSKILAKIHVAQPCPLDRWAIHIEHNDPTEKRDPVPYTIINNYFSIGVDASIAHRFHMMREKHPEKFNSRTKNKLWYFEFGTGETLWATCKNLHEDIDILCDGVSLELGTRTALEGIALLNIPSIYGGSNLWGESGSKKKTRLGGPLALPSSTQSMPARARPDKPSGGGGGDLQHMSQDIGDRLIEVVGLESSMAVGMIKAGLRASGRRLAQCQTVVIRTRKSFPMQIDGEPWMQPPCTITITHKNQAPMLVACKPRKRKPWDFLLRHGDTNLDAIED